ncbi:phosphopantetheine-binding protein [Actinomyces mediterranea]|uniref:phosphopantetheine-binding protein n=1 Tax=Actinomyces mediterranea TaxID=1871028 RepID=UPI000970FB26|nr:phosphopantetheine-binding protein [Actinomyces mediterranea]
MGTIAELLGYSLSESDASPEPSSEPGGAAGSEGEAPSDPQSRDGRETAMSAVLEETDLDPDRARAELLLTDDLDLDTLSLYAIVARIEHDLSISIPDETIGAWRSLGDLLDGVDAAAR